MYTSNKNENFNSDPIKITPFTLFRQMSISLKKHVSGKDCLVKTDHSESSLKNVSAHGTHGGGGGLSHCLQGRKAVQRGSMTHG